MLPFFTRKSSQMEKGPSEIFSRWNSFKLINYFHQRKTFLSKIFEWLPNLVSCFPHFLEMSYQTILVSDEMNHYLLFDWQLSISQWQRYNLRLHQIVTSYQKEIGTSEPLDKVRGFLILRLVSKNVPKLTYSFTKSVDWYDGALSK